MRTPSHGYWADVGTVQAYYEANMALLGRDARAGSVRPGVGDPHPQRGAAGRRCIGAEARAQGNLLCDGCQVEGTVIRSMISPGVYVAPGAIVRDSILMTDAVIEAGAEVDRAIVDKRVRVGGRAWSAGAKSTPRTSKWPERLNTGLTVVGETRRPPAGRTIGRNVVIHTEGFRQGACRRRSCERRPAVGG